jgi:hypothetical protein
MDVVDHLGRVRALSNEALLQGLGDVLGSSRRLVALVLVHLGEVEERRLHLLTGYPSMFEYCTIRLGMSDDEACRRIDVARLVRRFPELLGPLASGLLSLSVAALLKHRLTDANRVPLIAAVSGKTIRQAREVLVAWFPEPDVPPSIRKLPEQRAAIGVGEQPVADSTISLFGSNRRASIGAGDVEPGNVVPGVEVADVAPPTPSDATAPTALTRPRRLGEQTAPDTRMLPVPLSPPSRDRRSRANIAPLSPGRFKVTFTASGDLKQKLDLARDLLRHAVPNGDLATIVGRALDLLIERTEKRRFAKASQPKKERARTQRTRDPDAVATARAASDTALVGSGDVASVGETTSIAHPAPPAPPCAALPSRHLPAAVRRAVHERDGARCSWQAADGTRCNSRAWLEHDHVVPRGRGGADDPANIRPYCRAHNRLAAEHAYGQATIARIIARRRAARDGVRAQGGHPPA